MPSYTYLAADARSNEILAELPLKSVSFERRLNGAGALSATLPLGDSRITLLDPVGSTEPGRTILYVDRDGILVWGGMLWTRRYQSGPRTLQLGAREWFSYFDRRRIQAVTYTGVDQMAIAADLVARASAVAGGDIGVVVVQRENGLAMERDRTYAGLEVLSEQIEDLSALENGFDFGSDVFWDGDHQPVKQLTLDHPRRGVAALASGWLFELPGNITSYDYPEDGTQQAIVFYGVGANNGDAMLTSTVWDTTLLDDGYPLLEDSASWKDVSEQDTLDAHSIAYQVRVSHPVAIPSISVRADADPVLGSYIVGDECRVRIFDERFPAGLDANYRIVAIEVRPQDGAQAETVTLTLGEAF